MALFPVSWSGRYSQWQAPTLLSSKVSDYINLRSHYLSLSPTHCVDPSPDSLFSSYARENPGMLGLSPTLSLNRWPKDKRSPTGLDQGMRGEASGLRRAGGIQGNTERSLRERHSSRNIDYSLLYLLFYNVEPRHTLYRSI